VLRAGFGKRERAVGKIESSQAVAARQLCFWRPPVQAARNHQVQDEPEIAFHSDRDSLADSTQFAHNAAFDIRKGRLGGAKQKGAGQSNSFERLRKDASFECRDVGGDIRQLRHACQLAGRACIFASSLFAIEKNCQRPLAETTPSLGSPALQEGGDKCRVRYTLANMDTSAGEGARFEWASDQSLLVYLGQQITVDANERIRKLLRLLELEPIAGIRNLHPAYCSVLVKFDAIRVGHDELESILKKYLKRLKEVSLPELRKIEIPVCYGGEYGPDLGDVATMHGISPDQVIELHASTSYHVYFLGFVPGFAYLGELPGALVTPRLAAPRRSVPAGSVGIAGNQPVCTPSQRPAAGDCSAALPSRCFDLIGTA
jgi:inhibitor of KinA